ncbi:nitroreductase family deazaflavin-dependent oxidoreductase [Nocardia sp. 004]|uniref:nitroreductase family deazaflavin-dependent oxidoreductase n=1 Tax=Nocardia sp. 004 TaxID=3385978 RepID=UPI00399F9A5B
MADLFTNILKAHQWMYEKSGGWVGHRLMFGKPTLLLRTVGRKTGKDRTSALIYARDGADYLVVASNGGQPKPPGWLANLKARPKTEVQIGRRKVTVTAQPLLPGDSEYARLWDVVNAGNSDRYRAYQEQTTRPIPVVVLTPVS